MDAKTLLKEGKQKFGKDFKKIAVWIAEQLCDELGFDAIDILLELKDM